MNDRLAESISKFVTRINYSNLKSEVIQEAKLRLLDSIGVAIGSLWSNANKRARKTLYNFKVQKNGARVWGTDIKLAPDHATFINGLLIRYLDFNDTYLSKEPQHPSDMIAALTSIGETFNLDGKSLITGIVVGYEVGMRLCDAASLRVRGWDHVNFTMLGAVAGMCNMLKLDEDTVYNALGITIVPHVALRQTRAGKVTMWKAVAASNANRNAVLAVLLALNKYEGPDQPFVGEMGMINQLLGGEFEWKPFDELHGVDSPVKILESYMKFHPVEYHAQSAVDAVMKLIEKGVKYSDIEKIEVGTVQATYDIIVKHPEKWDPETRETADHSLPYIIASTFANEGIWIDSFEGDELKNPRTRELMKKMDIRVDPELDKAYPEAIPNKITVKTKTGEIFTEQVMYPTGHPKRDDDVVKLVKDKFIKLTSGVLSEDQVRDLFKKVENLENVSDVTTISEILIL